MPMKNYFSATLFKSLTPDQLSLVRLQKGVSYKILQTDAFRVISDWYHYTILELTFVEGFRNDPTWIANKLGITQFEAKEAIARLKRLELLEEISGKLVKTDTHLASSNGVPSD